MADIAKDLRRFAVEVATELSDETAAIAVAVLTDAADEIERLRAENQRLTDENARAWNACNEEYERKEQLQSLIDANIDAAAAHADKSGALLAAATPKEDDRA